MAITTLHGQWLSEMQSAFPPTVVSAVPGSVKEFDMQRGKWVDRPSGQPVSVPLLATEGLAASIPAGTERSVAATRFVLWLGSKGMSKLICSQSEQCAPSRKGHLANPQAWIGERFPVGASRQYSKVIEELNEQRLGMSVLCLPGRDQYLGKLNIAVARALKGEIPPAEALRETVVHWRAMTDERDMEKQKSAFRKGVGLSK